MGLSGGSATASLRSTGHSCPRSRLSPTAFGSGAPELLAHFDEPTTDRYAEGKINKVKLIKRRAYGLPSFDGLGERVLLACA